MDLENTDDLKPLTFREIFEAATLEKNRNVLVPLGKSFYDRIGLYLRDLIEDYDQKCRETDDLSPEIKALGRELSGIKKAVGDIIYLRVWKLMKTVIMKRIHTIIQSGDLTDEQHVEALMMLDEEEEKRLTEDEISLYYAIFPVLIENINEIIEKTGLS